MSEPPVLGRVEGHVGVLTYNRPGSLNAFNSALLSATADVLRQFSEDETVRAVVVHGAGSCFSAGFDMKESAQRQIRGVEAWRAVLEADFDFIMQFWDCRKPTIAAVHGYCLAGAFEVMLACDMSLAGESALFGEPEVRFGSGILAMLLPWNTGPKQAKELLLTGVDRVSARRAYDLGLLNRVVADDEVFDAAMALACTIAAASPDSVRLTKRAINRTYEMANMRQALLAALETDIAIEAAESPERAEFNRIRQEKGLKAAIAWRDGKFRP